MTSVGLGGEGELGQYHQNTYAVQRITSSKTVSKVHQPFHFGSTYLNEKDLRTF